MEYRNEDIESSDDLAVISGGTATRRVEVKRVLPFAIVDVWAALIEPDAVSQWFADWTIAPHEGGRIGLCFGKTTVAGTIKTFMPPNVLAYTWEQEGEDVSLVQYDLMALTEDETLLTIVQTPLSSADAADVAAGWHSMADRLRRHLDTREFAPQDGARWQKLYDYYQRQSA